MFMLDIPDLGDAGAEIVRIVQLVIDVIKWAVPALLIIFGGIDLGKAVVAGKDDEMKKAQQLLFKRIVSGVLVFLLGTIISLIINVVSPGDELPGDLNVMNNVETVEVV